MTLFFSLLMIFMQTAWASKLFFFDDSTKGKCLAKTVELPNKIEKIELSFKTCPENLIWDGKRNRILTIEDGQFWERPLTGDNRKSLGKISEHSGELWIEKDTGHPRFSFMIDVPEKNVKVEGKEIDQVHIYQFEGKTYKAQMLPDWGVAAMAITIEFKKGLWSRIEMAPTKTGAGDTPGITALETYNQRKSDGQNLSEILKQSTCIGGKLQCSTEDKNLKKLLANPEDAGVIKTSHGTQFFFPVGYGDSPHAGSPLYFCQGSCKKAVKLNDVKEDQIGLALDKDYLLVATEYENAAPRIYDAKTGALILSLPKAKSAIWLNGRSE
jgi:hypothetical protein